MQISGASKQPLQLLVVCQNKLVWGQLAYSWFWRRPFNQGRDPDLIRDGFEQGRDPDLIRTAINQGRDPDLTCV